MKFGRHLFSRIADRIVLSPCFYSLPDELFLKTRFLIKLGKRLNLKNPKSFSEKIQYLKIHDKKDEYVQYVDKIESRKIALRYMDESNIIPILKKWGKPKQIDISSLPSQFVLKCNHDSGSSIVCYDKNDFDINLAINKLTKSYSTNYFYSGREWPYKFVRPCVFAEKILNPPIDDYKVYCFEGKPHFIVRCSDLNNKRAMDFYDLSWKRILVRKPGHPTAPDIPKPVFFDRIIDWAESFSKGKHFLRVDFVYSDKCIYFGELTLYASSGFNSFIPADFDYELGNLIQL